VQFVLLASLWWLSEHGSSTPSQAGLAEQAGTDPMMTSQVVRKLQARGLLERSMDPQDSRARRLRLTAAGRELAARALADVETADDRYFAAIADDLPVFVRALATLGQIDGTNQP
jgi:DNA-binding MarR family transcriptional regulator